MVGGGHHYDVAGQLIELHQQERHDALDLARLVDVAAFLADRVELVKEQHAGRRPDVVEQAGEPGVGLPEIGADQGVVANCQQWNGDRFGDRFRERGLAVARWTGKEDAVPRLHALRAQEVGAVVFLDELPGQMLGRQCQDQAFQPNVRFRLNDEIAAGCTGPAEFAGRGDGYRRERAVELVGEDVMALRALLGDKGLYGRGQRRTIAGRSCLHQRNKEITSGHLLRTYPVACAMKRNTSAFPLKSLKRSCGTAVLLSRMIRNLAE